MQIPVKLKRPQDEEEPRREPEAQAEMPAAQVPPAPAEAQSPAEEIDWRDMALRLQAEMDNFRKRQQRLAQDSIASDRERLLRGVLPVADNLERALSGNAASGSLRQGVEVTYNALIQYLRQQGVERVEITGKPFDPAWHEAVSTVPSAQYGVEPQTVVATLEAAYRLGDRMLRPAKVIVAV